MSKSLDSKVSCDSKNTLSNKKEEIYESKGFDSSVTLEKIRSLHAAFSTERDWNQYHTPRNVLLAMTGEVGELCECFQWRGEVKEGLPETQDWSEEDKVHVGEEMSDVLIYLIRLADRCGIDLSLAVLDKLKKNSIKYPIDLVRGSSKKYTDYNNNNTVQDNQNDI